MTKHFFLRFNPENFPKISKERFSELQGAFSLLDKDELGFIKTRDLKNALRFLGQKRCKMRAFLIAHFILQTFTALVKLIGLCFS